jgi:hypothetical protein
MCTAVLWVGGKLFLAKHVTDDMLLYQLQTRLQYPRMLQSLLTPYLHYFLSAELPT